MNRVPKGAVKGPDNKFLRNPDGSYVVRGQTAASKETIAPSAAPALDPLAALAALGITPDALRLALGMTAAAPAPVAPAPPPIGAGNIPILPLDAAAKEALFALGATDRREPGTMKMIDYNAVPTTELAQFLVDSGFPKKRGRTYDGQEHVKEVAIDLAALAKTSQAMRGWFRYIGGSASEPWNNFEWHISAEALAERPTEPAPARTAPTAVVLRKAEEGALFDPADLVGGKHSAAEMMPPKVVIAQIDHHR